MKRVRKTQKERRSESERKIIRAAIDLYSKQGYHKTTLVQVGEAAGYTGPLVSQRFGSKEGLLNAVVLRISDRFAEDQLGPVFNSDVSATEALCNFIEVYIGELNQQQNRMRALYVIIIEAFSGVKDAQAHVEKLDDRVREHLRETIARGVESGEFRKDANPATTAIFILGVVRGIAMQTLIAPKRVKLKGEIENIQHLLMRGLAD